MDFLDVPLSSARDNVARVDDRSARALKFARRLQQLLTIHDRTVIELQKLDLYIHSMKRSAIQAMQLGHKGRVLHYMGCTSVAAGVRFIYQQYRLQKWSQVQLLVSHIMQTLDPRGSAPVPHVTPEEILGDEGEQVKRYSHAMMVSFCNFSRFS